MQQKQQNSKKMPKSNSNWCLLGNRLSGQCSQWRNPRRVWKPTWRWKRMEKGCQRLRTVKPILSHVNQVLRQKLLRWSPAQAGASSVVRRNLHWPRNKRELPGLHVSQVSSRWHWGAGCVEQQKAFADKSLVWSTTLDLKASKEQNEEGWWNLLKHIASGFPSAKTLRPVLGMQRPWTGYLTKMCGCTSWLVG